MMDYVKRNMELHKDDFQDLIRPYMDYKPDYKN